MKSNLNFKATKNRKLKKKFIEQSLSLSLHGYPRIFRTSDKFLQIIWAVAFIVSLSACYFMIYKSVSEYLEHNVITRSREYAEFSMQFPAVTICNVNPYIYNPKDYLERFYYNKSENFSINIERKNSLEIHMQRKFSLLDKVSKKSFSPEAKNIIMFCRFNEKICDLSEFVEYHSFYYGRCFRFNSGLNMNREKSPIKSTLKGGRFNGLYLELFSGNVETDIDKLRHNYQPHSGFHIFISNQSTLIDETEGIDLKTGTMTSVQLKKVFTSKLPKPFSQCEPPIDNKFYSIISSLEFTYRQKDCLMSCEQEFFMKIVNVMIQVLTIYITGMIDV